LITDFGVFNSVKTSSITLNYYYYYS